MTTTAEHIKSAVPNISKKDVDDAIEKVKGNRAKIFAIAMPVLALALLVVIGIIERKELMKIIDKYR